jgi:hypothetical protein
MARSATATARRKKAAPPSKGSGQPSLYTARADEKVAKAKGANAPFTIKVRFQGGLTATQQRAFRAAADRWSTIIVGDLPRVVINGEVIDDVLIEAGGSDIDGPGKVLGQAGPTHLRPATAGSAAFLPAKGTMMFDSADLDEMEENGTLVDVITHEMGHVLGIGTIWTNKGLLKGSGTQNPTFVGRGAMKEYGTLKGVRATAVPVENSGGVGTRDSHWREVIFKSELMTGFISDGRNPISRLTVASLQDVGYTVDLTKAEAYALPNLMMLAEAGTLTPLSRRIEEGIMLPSIPVVLPAGSLQ